MAKRKRPPAFKTHTALGQALRQLFMELEARLGLTVPLKVYLAGGMAVHLYTGIRVTTDVDAEFSSRVLVPNDLALEVALENGQTQLMYLDTNYNASFALMHEDYQHDAIEVDLGLSHISVFVLSPTDLAVSKIARLSEVDKGDIRALVEARLTTARGIETRALTAVGGYVGRAEALMVNIREAVQIAKVAESA